MNKNIKIFSLSLIVFTLLCLTVLPAMAYTTYYTGTNYYSTRTIYNAGNSGTYSTRYNNNYYYYYPKPVVTPPPTKPGTGTTTPKPTATPIPTTKPTAPAAPSTGGTSLTTEESKMVNLVNQERMAQGVRPLSVNQQLVSLARLKSQDIVKNNYFDHTSPTYGSPFDMMKNAGVKYSTAGENLAGASTTESAHQNLMNSPGHRANILNGSFNQVGIGIASGSPYGNIFTQMFIGI